MYWRRLNTTTRPLPETGNRGVAAAVGIAVACLVLLLGQALPVWSQSEAVNGSIRGQITDPNGAAVGDAQVTVTNTDTGFSRMLTTNTDGYYVAANLPLGSYTVTVEKDGFSKLEATGVVLEAGRDAVIDGALKLGTLQSIVEVTGGAPIIEPTRTNIGRTITQAEITNLPLTSRNPYNFILFQPGVSGHPNPELGIPRTINTNGQMDRINYQMDGMVDTESDRYGLRLFPISDVYVREVQTVANSFAPEFGNTTGNIYNVISNSGTNEIHGVFQWIRRTVDGSARPLLLAPTAAKPDLKLSDYSANLGGPLIRNKLFLFGGYEHMTRGSPMPNTITAADATALGLSSNLLTTAPGLLHGQFGNIRADWTISPRNQIFVRYNLFRNDFPFNTSVGNIFALDAATDFRDRAHVVGTQLITTLSPTLLNELRFSWAYRSNTHFNDALTGSGPQIFIPSHAVFGGSGNVPSLPNQGGAGDIFTEKIPNWSDNVTWIHAAHTMKFGASMSVIQDLQRSQTFAQYQFPTIATYLAAKSPTATNAQKLAYATFTSNADPNGVNYQSVFYGFYAQDSWQVRPSILLIYGLRWDRYQAPPANPSAPFVDSRQFNSPGKDFSPRLGIAWRAGAKTVVRASWGMFYDPAPTNLWFNSLNQDGSNRISAISLSGTNGGAGTASPGAPLFPSTTVSGIASPIQSVVTVAPNFKNAYAENASLQVTRELSQNDSFSLGYVNTSGHQLLFLHNINLINPTGALADGRPIFLSAINAATRLDPRFNNVSLQDSGANSNYNALLATYQHRFARGYQVSASYTFSHTISDAPDVNSFEQNLPIEDPTSRKRDRGNSSVNRPQAFTISAVLEPRVNVDEKVLHTILNGNMFAILANLESGDPQNVTTGGTLNGDSTTSSVTRPAFVGRNTVRGPAIYQIDLRYTRTVFTFKERVRAQFIAESNNLFNHPNITTVKTSGFAVNSSGVLLAPLPSTFAPASTVLEARIVQFGLAVRW
jgi:hypothetical protein